jgi:hypothetical protein
LFSEHDKSLTFLLSAATKKKARLSKVTVDAVLHRKLGINQVFRLETLLPFSNTLRVIPALIQNIQAIKLVLF